MLIQRKLSRDPQKQVGSFLRMIGQDRLLFPKDKGFAFIFKGIPTGENTQLLTNDQGGVLHG